MAHAATQSVHPGEECRHFLKLRPAAVEFGSQRSVGQPNILVQLPGEADISGADTLWFVFLTTWAGWRRHQLQLLMHVITLKL